ncbi:hypothetical protein FHS83_003195 [Rhizomicrobium palustre]|uniref:DUF4440 domain-containing protein n=1 Tax=Rhizomicrobium palustre TaxID=189966 RepID=A0A846N454_9PROT|nr:nuclear transport factor 2 family protein [Rhizomicrobium palustre]NIK89877.1 hypothetical protein [Rhizomicrobium palustre]
MKAVYFAAVLAFLAGAAQAAEMPLGEALTKAIADQDAKLFGAYNACDTATMAPMVAEDLEFYHDQSGLAVGREPFIASIKQYVCGKTRRDLIASTLKVYPLKNYGAIELGEHVFCDPKKFERCDPENSGIGKFFMLWRWADGNWQLTRVISYDHLNDWQRKPAK